MKLQEYFLYAKKNKNNDFIQQLVSSVLQQCYFGEYIHWTQTAYASLCQPHYRALRWRRGDKLINKVIIFVFFAYQNILVAS